MVEIKQKKGTKDGMDAKNKKLKNFTMKQVRDLADEGELVFVVDGKVVNATKWATAHPGGLLVLKDIAGRDATEPFFGFHGKEGYDKLKYFEVGQLQETSSSKGERAKAIEQDFLAMKEEIKKAGLFNISPWHFVFTFLRVLVMFAVSAWLVFYGRDEQRWELQLLGGALIGLTWQQLALMAHDTCHNNLTHVRSFDYLFSVFASSLLGVSPSWWKDTHNIHHLLPNSVIHDPDIQHLPFLAVDSKFFGSLYSLYHLREMTFDKVARWMISYQHWVFFPLMALARVNLYIQSYLYLAGMFNGPRPKEYFLLEIPALALFWVWYGYLLMQLGPKISRT